MTSAAIVCVAIATPAQAQTRSFDVSAENAAKGVADFARQADIQLLISAKDASGKRTNAVHGSLTVEEGLRKLLVNTGLRAQSTGPQTYSVMPSAEGNAGAAETAASKGEGTAAGAATGSEGAQQQAIVVTGSHIRGVGDPTQPLQVYDRSAISRSGYQTTETFIQSIPQVFRGGADGMTADGHLGSGTNAQTNNEFASGVNLRGLGTTATLVLLNNHRVAPSVFGDAVDISSIPLDAIDRIEVLADGASAIYGSDAVAGVVNFVLRKDYDGSVVNATIGSVTDGGLRSLTVGQTTGKTWTGGGAVVSLQYRDDTSLGTTDRTFTATAPQPTDITPARTQYAAIASFHQDLAQGISLSSDASYSLSRVSNAEVALGKTILMDSKVSDLSAHADLAARLFSDWKLTGSGLYSNSDLHEIETRSPTLSGFQNGTLFQKDKYSIYEADAVADGSLFSLPGGKLRAAIGGSYRKDTFTQQVPYLNQIKSSDRHILSAFAEANIPLVSAENGVPLIDQLSVDAAIRYDRYSDFGGTTNPKVGLLWVTPIDGLRFRASYNSSFRAPNPGEEFLSRASFPGGLVVEYPLPSPTGGTVPVFILAQPPGNFQLKPETSKSITAGVDWQPSWARGLDISVDYYRVDYRNRIIVPPFSTSALLNPTVYGSLIHQFTSSKEAQDFLNAFLAQQGTFSNPFKLSPSAAAYTILDYQTNFAVLKQSGFDLLLTYDRSIDGGVLHASANLAYIASIDQRLTPTSNPVKVLNTFGNPLRFRGRGELAWTKGEWSFNSALNYANPYSDTTDVPVSETSAFLTVDLGLRFEPRAIAGLSLAIQMSNLFDRNPPFVIGNSIEQVTNIHYDAANASPIGRFVSFSIRQKW